MAIQDTGVNALRKEFVPRRAGFMLLFWRIMWRSKTPLVGLIVVTVVVLLALLAPVLPLKDPDLIDTKIRLQPWFTSSAHLLGTDELGRDILSRLVWGGRVSLMAGLLSAIISMVFGVTIGLTAPYVGGWVDTLSMRFMDILLAFPPLLLAIALVAGLGPGLRNAILALSIIIIPVYARIVRGVVLGLKEYPYVEAAKSIGAGHIRVLGRHILPNSLAPIIVMFTLDVGQKIVFTSALSFLGLGSQPPTSDWGAMLSAGRSYITTAPHVSTIPGIAIFIVVLALNLMGDGLRDALDPRVARSTG